MPSRRFIPIVLAITALAVPIAATSGARASPSPHQANAPNQANAPTTTRAVEIEVTDTEKGHPPRVVRFTLSVEAGEWSRVTTHADSETYKLAVRVENDRLRLDINRTDTANQSPEMNANIVANVPLNKRTVVGKMQRQNGSTTEVAVIVR